MSKTTNNKKTQDPVDEIDEKDFPEEIREALTVIVGNRPKSFDEEFTPNPQAAPNFKGAAFAGKSSQEEFVKKKDPIEKFVKFTNNQIFLLDITQKSDLEKYEQILDSVFDPESGVQLVEPIKEPHYLLDQSAPQGFRALITIKTTKPVECYKKSGTGYTVVKKK